MKKLPKKEKEKMPVFTFNEVKRIYKNKKSQSNSDFSFVSDIFEEIRKKYIEKARKQGKDANQSWNAWSGKNFQKLISFIITDFISSTSWDVGVTDDNALRHNLLEEEFDKVRRNIVVFYGQYDIVPDADIVIYDKKCCKIIAILSCKASLRERIAQAAYWKVKLQSSIVTKHVLCYLISLDRDGDFFNKGEDISRNRIIVEFGELDGAYILNDIPESNKIKHFNKIFNDLDDILRKWFATNEAE
ncbi:MAG: BsaWI family type II restriction enzyme [Myxococcota bacterium]